MHVISTWQVLTTQNKSINHLAVTMWPFWACRKVCWFTPQVMRQSCCHVNKPLTISCLMRHQMFPESASPNVSRKCVTKCFQKVRHQMFPESASPNVSRKCVTKCFQKVRHQMFPENAPHHRLRLISPCWLLQDSMIYWAQIAASSACLPHIYHLSWMQFIIRWNIPSLLSLGLSIIW